MTAITLHCTPVIARTRKLLSHRTLIVVGGDRREMAIGRLASAFDLGRVVHCVTEKNDASNRRFARSLRDPHAVLVVWLLGLSRTHHGRQLHKLCREVQIPWVDCFRVPHPSLLAAMINDLNLWDSIRDRHRVCAGHVFDCEFSRRRSA